MKNIIALTLFLTILSFSSCKKKGAEPAAPTSTATVTAPESIKVQYRVTSASAHFNVEYTSLQDGQTTTTSVEVNKINFTYSFNWTKKQKLSITAFNSTPSGKEVMVEIYVNDVLFKSGSANAPGASAIAEGVYN